METKDVEINEEQWPTFRDIRRYYCEHCGICRSKKSLIRSHILSHHKDEVQEINLDEDNACKELRQKVCHACEECGASFWKPAHLLQHMRSHSVEACGLNLSFCKINLKRSVKHWIPCNELQNAMRQKSFLEWTSIRMGDLLRSSTRKASLTHHLTQVKLDCLEIICGELGCMKPFTNAECLKAHIQSCHKYIRCEVCGTQQLKKNFKRHQRAHEGVAKKKAKCSFKGCGHTFSNKSNLYKHVKAVHEELRPFCCRTSGCHQKFPYKHVRDNHEKTHEYEQGNFLEADEQWSSQTRGGRKRQRITVEMLTRKRVAPLGRSSVLDDGANYLRWMLSDNE